MPIAITIVATLLPHYMLNAKESPLPAVLQKEISEWRVNTLPSIQPEDYWANLKAIGEKVGDALAIRIEEVQASDIDSAIALMAYKLWSQPHKVDELAGWYGVYAVQVTRELRGIEDDELWQIIQQRFNAMRTETVVEGLQEKHQKREFLHAWEAWMLSPHSLQRLIMQQRMNEALAAIGDERTIGIMLEKCRVLSEHNAHNPNPKERQKAIKREAGDIRGTIRAIGGKWAVLGLLECARMAEAKGYGGEGADSARSFVIYLLSSSRHPRSLEENPEFAESLRDPENPAQLVPWDDKWKEFKPIIEAMLKEPEGLRAEDIQTLRAALAAMPNV